MALIDDIAALFEATTSTEIRLAITASVVVTSLVAAVFFAPRIVGLVQRIIRAKVFNNSRIPIDAPKINWSLPVAAFIRTVQLAVLLAAGITLLVAWGYIELATVTLGLVTAAIPQILKLLITGGVVVGALVGIDLLETRLESYAEESDTLDEHQQGIVFRVLQISVLIAATLAGLSVWGVNPAGLLVGAGFLGIVIGTAARTTLGSLIAGFVLMFSRPFEIGDWVEIDSDEGNVSEITIINTRIRNQHGEVVVIPNERVANATITNRSRRGQLRLSVDVGIDYDVQVEDAEDIAQEALKAVDPIIQSPRPQVVPKALGDSAVVLECRFWIDHPSAARRSRAKAAVVREVKHALDTAGIKIPYPQRELMGREETGGFTTKQVNQVRSSREPEPSED